MPTPPDDALEAAKRGNLGQLLLRSARLFDGLAFARFAQAHPQIRRAHLQLMPHLDLEGTRITELARRAEITKQAVGQLVTDLEAAGYVERTPDPSDQRAKIVTLTERGRRGMMDGLGVFAQLVHELSAEVGERTIDRLIEDLESLQAALEKRAR